MRTRRRFVWLALVGVGSAWGCTNLLGVDLDYHPLGTGGSGGSATASTASTGGASTGGARPTTTSASTSGTGGISAGTGGTASDAGQADASDAGQADASDASPCDASIPDAGAPCADIDGGPAGQLVVNMLSIVGGIDDGALMAVADGAPGTQFGNAALWAAEKAKTWYALNPSFPFATPQQTFSLCVPTGDYTLSLWDRISQGTFDNGLPPNVTYIWAIGNSSHTLTVTAGAVVNVTVTDTTVDVPDGGAFYGSWSTWDYGPCSCAESCPSGTTCNQGTCIDLAYDIRNCGAPGAACGYSDCCASSCVAELSDNANCGSCGVACVAPQTCQSGACK